MDVHNPFVDNKGVRAWHKKLGNINEEWIEGGVEPACFKEAA